LAISLSIVSFLGQTAKAEATDSPPITSTFTLLPTSPDFTFKVKALGVADMHPELASQLKSKKGGSIAFWEAVSWCETNHKWNDGGYYSGGLGMAQSVWLNYGGRQFASRPSKATKEEQIIIANRAAFFGFQTKTIFGTLDDKLNNKPYFRPAVGWRSMKNWGGDCVNWKTRKPLRDKYTQGGNVHIVDVKKSSGRVSSQSLSTDKSCPQYESLLKKYGLPVKEFSYIMWRESRCEPKAIGWNYKRGTSHQDCRLSPAQTYKNCSAVRSYDTGLLQINSGWKSVTAKICNRPYRQLIKSLTAPSCNLMVAKYLYDNGGIGHWKGTSGKK
jgi:hypothetical protein